jgi:hypothetical protein
MKSIVFAAIAGVSLALAVVAHAGEIKMSGENVVMAGPSTTTELPNGLTYLTVSNTSVLRTAKVGAPFDKAVMSCLGSCTMDANGENGLCMGSCSGHDRDGDLFMLTWDGFTGGGWAMAAGTGKWAGSTGGGTWEVSGQLAEGLSLNSWTGTVNFK